MIDSRCQRRSSFYLGPGPKINRSTEENGGLGYRDNRWFRDCDEEDMTDQKVLLIGFAIAALVVLVLYLVRRRRRLVIW